MRVLVTGHQGYIGSVLCPLLRAQGHAVVGLDTGYFDGCDFGASPDPIATIRRDVRDLTGGDLQGIDAVVHLAGLSNDPMGQLNPRLTDEINHHGSVHLAELSRAAGAQRFVFSSSCSIYGVDDGAAADESAAFKPLSAYAQSKIDAERGISALASDSFSPVFLRNATAYGVSSRMRMDLVVNNLIGWALTTGEIRIMSDGLPWRPLVHVADIANAIAAALVAPRQAIHNQAFNVGRDRDNHRVRDIAEIVRRAVPGARIVYAGTHESDRRSYRVRFAKIAHQLPGFSPSWEVERGVAEAVDAFRQRRIDREQFEGRKYIRLKQLSYLLGQGHLNVDLRWAASSPQSS